MLAPGAAKSLSRGAGDDINGASLHRLTHMMQDSASTTRRVTKATKEAWKEAPSCARWLLESWRVVHHTATTIRTNIKSRRTFSVSGLLCAAHLSIIETKESLLGWPGFFIFNSSSNSIIVLGFQLNGWVWMAQDQFNNILYVSLAASNHKWSPSQFIFGIQSIFFRITMSQK